MNTSLIINSTDSNGKAYQKSISNINPEKANATLGEFAQMLNGLSTNTYVNASRVDKSDVTEEGGGSGGGSTPAKTEPTLTITVDESKFPLGGTYTYDGDGDIFAYASEGTLYPLKISVNRTEKTWATDYSGEGGDYNLDVYLCASEGTNYASKVAHAQAQHGPT